MNLSQEQIQEIKDMLDSISVFTTPIEQLKNWNEYKEDAKNRINKIKKLFEND